MKRHEAFDSCYGPHLDRVSRSFTLCIRQLDDPLRSWTALAYLICRLLDTVEDAPWADVRAQNQAFATLQEFLVRPPTSLQVEIFCAQWHMPLPEGERLLLLDSHRIMQHLHELPQGPKEAIVDVARRMAAGMGHYAHAWVTEGRLTLLDMEDVNRYCYFVAGVVGEVLTRLFVLAEGLHVPEPSVWRDAQHFGLFLQKVNLLKDQRGDEAENRFLCPSRALMLASMQAHAEGALRYVTALPTGAKKFRIFCAWSMFLGAVSLPQIEASYRGQGSNKIDRAQTQWLMEAIAAIACDNDALAQAMQEAMALVPKPDEASKLPPLDERAQAIIEARQRFFLTLHHGPLREADLCALNMVPPPQSPKQHAPHQ